MAVVHARRVPADSLPGRVEDIAAPRIPAVVDDGNRQDDLYNHTGAAYEWNHR